jgi:hypothetical protein
MFFMVKRGESDNVFTHSSCKNTMNDSYIMPLVPHEQHPSLPVS